MEAVENLLIRGRCTDDWTQAPWVATRNHAGEKKIRIPN